MNSSQLFFKLGFLLLEGKSNLDVGRVEVCQPRGGSLLLLLLLLDVNCISGLSRTLPNPRGALLGSPDHCEIALCKLEPALFPELHRTHAGR